MAPGVSGSKVVVVGRGASEVVGVIDDVAVVVVVVVSGGTIVGVVSVDAMAVVTGSVVVSAVEVPIKFKTRSSDQLSYLVRLLFSSFTKLVRFDLPNVLYKIEQLCIKNDLTLRAKS